MNFTRILCLALLLSLCACASLAYYSQAVFGHLKLAYSRDTIADVLADDELTADLRRKLQAVQKMRTFASQQLGLPNNDSYRYFTRLDHDYVVWNVVATPEFSLSPLAWCYPVAGCVTYRGYFDRADATAFADQIRQQGFDVAVSGATAYSTLGWFADPILSSMLDYPKPDLAGLIFHELAHQRVYVKGDSAFNEAFASFVEAQGVQQWLQYLGNPKALRGWRRGEQRAERFTALLLDARDELAALYEKHQDAGRAVLTEAKHSVFDALRKRYRQAEFHGAYDGWMKQDLNNAHLALIATYQGGVPAFEALFEQVGGDWKAFYQAVKRIAERDDEARARWLAQSEGVPANG